VSSAPQTPFTDVTRHILVAIGLVAVAAMVWISSDAWIIGFGGIVFATILRVLTEPLARVTGWRERWALAIVVIGLAVALGLLFWLFGNQATNQFAEMRQQLPAAVDKLKAWLVESSIGRIADGFLKQGSEGSNPLSSAGVAFSAVLGGLGNVLLILFVGVYFAADPNLYRNGALRLLPPRRRARVRRALDDAGVALRKWLVAQIIVMVAVGVMTGIGLALLGIPLSLSLGLIAGLFEFVPVVGPVAAAVPAALIAFSQGPQTALYVIILYIVVQQIESNILTPLIQRWAVELPPVIALLSIVVCGLLFGVMGVIFATPLAVVVLGLVQHLYVEDTLEEGSPTSKRGRAAAATRAE
jgi:predicted PurR-regulated permease PerM